MKTYIKTVFTVLFATLFLYSCEDMLNQSNPNQATDDTFWENEADFNAALTSCYTPLKNALGGGYYGTRGVMMRIVRADEIDFRSSAVVEINKIHRFTNDNANSLSQGMFYQFYNALYRTNLILQKLEEKKNVFSQEFSDAVIGECLFIRGFYLFQLGKEFKDAPLRLTASQSPSSFPLAKSSQAEIWKKAAEDLGKAAAILPLVNAVGKPTQGAALAALGKIKIYQKDWKGAITTLEPLTKSPYTYKLASDFEWNFDEAHENSANPESIFELLIEDLGGDDVYGNGEIFNSTQSNTRPKEWAANEVEGWGVGWASKQILDIFLQEKDKDGNSDYRARTSLAWDYSGCMYYQKPFQTVFGEGKETQRKLIYILKYQNWKVKDKEASPTRSFINERAIRYAEVLLLLAEANLNEGKPDVAIGYIDQIRKRANLNVYSGPVTKEAVFAELIHQRAIEFFVDGERFYDLRRWGLLEDVLKTADPVRYQNFISGKAGSFNKYEYFPIPDKELNTNELCTPSEGW